MRKRELRELADSREFISGIYNYCDRWCERCPLTAHCLVYATDKADSPLDEPAVHDVNSARFWSRLEAVFQEAREMILDWAEEAGVDMQAVEIEAAAADRDQHRQDAEGHELSLSARRYAEGVQRWFTDEFAVEEQVHDDTTGKSGNSEDDLDISDAIAVIRWYQFFIAAKIFRALMGRKDILSGDEAEDEELLHANEDSDGSAKIALIGMDRSSSAWRIMLASLPEKADSIKALLIELERMRRAAEQAFPEARDFIRPGFDEVNSEFMN